VTRLLGGVLLLALAGGGARADDMEGDAVYIPMPQGESLAVRNPLGSVRVRGWDEAQVKIVAAKRARSAQLLDRLKVRVNIDRGRLDVAVGVYLGDGTWRPLPQSGAAVDLTIDVPRRMALAATTFTGDIDAAGLRSGARLSSTGGEIHAADIEGQVDTRSAEGRQQLQAIHGRLAADGLDGDVELESVEGDTLDATVVKGQISAREVRSRVVRLRSVRGAVVFVGALQPGGRYELTSHDGDVRMVLRGSGFRVVARAPQGKVASGFQLDGSEQVQGVLRGEWKGGGPSLELVSLAGNVSLQPER
jgi:DUF4097 and DUF4098 domain-containing protein YvlB